ncbi:tetratricopeptide repeat protein [Stappia indica]|uniref:tetratricopeptide repeat protein n=1 Tax=Stappia indica TaxID=538381 RepID=UPI001CD370A7|nr:tetratricopeptide repeat protein [Stappia indica]MCA1297896.1 tetratricopeptide repeat protein [Stappia indica]
MTPRQAASRLSPALANEDWATARKCLLVLVRADPANASLRYNLGLVHRRLGANDLALAALSRALDLSPDHANARFEQASVLLELGRLGEAAEAFDAYTRQAPKDADGWLNLARLRLRLDQAEQALEAFVRHDTLTGGDLESRIGLAEAQLRLGQPEGAATLQELYRDHPALRPRLLKSMSQGPRGRIPLRAGALLTAPPAPV